MKSVRGRTVSIALAAFFAAACSSGPAGLASPTTTAPPSASPSPAPTATPFPAAERLTTHRKGSESGAAVGYLEYLPPGYGDGTPRPLLLFFHGSGESGDGSEADLGQLERTGLPRLIAQDQWPSDRPFIVLMPQHEQTDEMPCPTPAEIDSFLTFARKHYTVDAAHIYLTGLSCGAFGAWDYLGEHTNEIVAAAVLIAGDGHGAVDEAGCALGRVAIWAFHGDHDPQVDPAGSSEPIAYLKACTSPKALDARLMLLPGGHNVWDAVYDGWTGGPDIYAWMLGHVHG